MNKDWKKRFMDFYMETGEYKGRKLGPEQYIDFIQSVRDEAVRERDAYWADRMIKAFKGELENE